VSRESEIDASVSIKDHFFSDAPTSKVSFEEKIEEYREKLLAYPEMCIRISLLKSRRSYMPMVMLREHRVCGGTSRQGVCEVLADAGVCVSGVCVDDVAHEAGVCPWHQQDPGLDQVRAPVCVALYLCRYGESAHRGSCREAREHP